MAVGTSVSVEEYLHTSYRPDCDYVDGEVLERNVGEFEHSGTQTEIGHYLRARYPRLRWRVLTEQRVQVRATRFRIPDVCVLAEDAPREKIIGHPPILCIEILSPEDRLVPVTKRLNDYFQMGVPMCWIIDPVARLAWIATPGLLAEVTDGILRSGDRAGDLEMPLAEVLE
jgi:Uma2 family endonuclease